MRGLRHIFVVLAFVGVLCVWAPAGAVAAGCHGSAGDSQYVDPLQHCNHPGTSHSGGSSGGGTSGSTTTPTSTVTPTTSTTTATTASTTTTTTTASAKGKDPKSLPFTGLDLVPALIVAFVLLASGLALRRVTGDTGSAS